MEAEDAMRSVQVEVRGKEGMDVLSGISALYTCRKRSIRDGRVDPNRMCSAGNLGGGTDHNRHK